jgi:hypothetical protein
MKDGRKVVGFAVQAIRLNSSTSGAKVLWQARHPPRYAAYLIPSSPTFPHSSSPARRARLRGGAALAIDNNAT